MPSFPHRLATVPALAAALAVAAAPAQARITSVSGQIEQIAQPGDARVGHLESNAYARAWDESQGYRLSAPLAVDVTLPGAPTIIPAGTVVSSHMIHADVVGAGLEHYVGSVSFSTPVVGVIRTDTHLVASDPLGAPTLFSTMDRGAEAGEVTIGGPEEASVSFTTTNQADEARVITMGYTFRGFFAPVDNPPVVNTVKAGSAVPLKFSLGGFQGYDIFGPASPSSSRTDCSSSAPLDDIETTVTPGASTLSYDATSDTYTYVWKTDKAWSGQCRTLTVTTADGGAHTALFQLP